MACYNPIQGYRAKYLNENGKRPVVFNTSAGYQDLPVTVPCGRCRGCRLEYSRQWAIRCVHEASLHQHNAYLTLTYNEENIPYDRSIRKDEIQRFLKRLRKNVDNRIRYFACGEYGTKYNRPHYHVIIFGYGFPDKRLETKRNGNLLYRSPLLEKTWRKGYSTIGEVTFQSAAYVARYVMKKRKGGDEEGNKRHYQIVDKDTGEIHQLEPEFCLMSRKPGIGSKWLQKYRTDTDKDFITLEGIKMKLPRYYDTIIERDNPEEYLTRKIERQKKIQKEENTTERLRVKEKIKIAKTDRLIRAFEEHK